MQSFELRLADIDPGEAYSLSYPPAPERGAALAEKFPGLPLLIADKAKRLVWGHDHFRYLLDRGRESAAVLVADLAAADALVLNYNLSNRLFGLNLYEKLLFVKKISPLLDDAEIRRRAELGFALSEPLRQALGVLLSGPFRASLAAGRLGLRTALQLAGMEEADRLALLAVLDSCGFSESQQALVTQMLEEVSFREKRPVAALLAAAEMQAPLAGEMPQKKFLAALHALRYPAWDRREQEWRAWQKKAAAGRALSLDHAPYFAREEVRVTLTVKDRRQAEEVLAALNKIL